MKLFELTEQFFGLFGYHHSEFRHSDKVQKGKYHGDI